jgi:hypothetical protein
MAVVDVSNIGIGDVIAGGGIGQFNPSSPLTATQQDAASLSESDEGGGDTGQFGETTITTFTNTTGAVTSVPTSRLISFTITSEPNGASILLDGVNTNFITPHVMKFEETELLTPKVISVVNGTNNSLETFILSTEVVTNVIGGTSGGGAGSVTGTGGAGNGSEDPLDNRGPGFGIDGGGRDRNNAQR